MAFDRREPGEGVPRSTDAERAVDLFARLLESGDDPFHLDRARFDELVRAHPELRDELLRIRDGMEKFASVRRSLSSESNLRVVKGGMRWRWVGGFIAAAGIAAVATIVGLNGRKSREHPTPPDVQPAASPATNVGIASLNDQLADAGLRYLEDIFVNLRRMFPDVPSNPTVPKTDVELPKAVPDAIALARGDRQVEQIVDVITAIERIEEIQPAGSGGVDSRRQNEIRRLITGSPVRWREQLGSALSNPIGSITDAAPLLLALTRDPKLQASLIALQKEGSLPGVLKQIVDAASVPAHLTLKVIDLDHGAVEVTGASVFVQPIDPVTGLLGPRESLGDTPLDDVDLAAGDWRITVVESPTNGSRHSELRLLAMPDETLAPRVAFFRATPEPGKSMVLLPAVPFHFGAPPKAKYTVQSDLPFTTDAVSEFWIDRTEVTCEEYSAFYRDALAHPEWFGGSVPIHRPSVLASDGTCPAKIARYPIVDVTWEEAVIFANWAGKRLPTEREWERAARGSLDEDRVYPWGDEFAPAGKRCVDTSESISPLANGPAKGASAPSVINAGPLDQKFVTLRGCDVDDPTYADGATPGGPATRLLRLGDNAAELVEDLYLTMRGPTPGLLRSTSVARVFKGGNWNTIDESDCTNWSRGAIFPEFSMATIGFRCAKTTRPFTASK